MIFVIYDCKQPGTYVVKKRIDLLNQIHEGGNPGFAIEFGDRITDVRLLDIVEPNGELLRVDYSKRKDQHFFIDVVL